MLTNSSPFSTAAAKVKHMRMRRVCDFSRNGGEFVRSFGEYGGAPGQSQWGHGLATTSTGLLVMSEIHGERLQVLTRSGDPVQELGGCKVALADPGVMELLTTSLVEGAEAQVVDFDEHFFDVSNDWRNRAIQ